MARLGMRQAIAKTITFRIIVTTLDFTTNYIVIGELTTAAGLSTFNLIVGPLFYLGHEAVWNYLGPDENAAVDFKVPLPQWAGAKERRSSRVYGEPGASQDHHIPNLRHYHGFHHELRSGPRRCDGSWLVGFRFRCRSVRLSRP